MKLIIEMNNSITILVLAAFTITASGCVSNEIQGAKITGDIGYSVGYVSENQTNFQRISWTASFANSGDQNAENVRAYVILNPEVVSRLVDSNMSSVTLNELHPGVWTGFKGNATFNATGLGKQDIAAWEPLVKLKVTWTENGRIIEKILPEARK
ncbi:Uncharacterised protein [uncultured archaeon]|nr:Uncharacterised protein [uncultured archaeon]